MKGWTFFIMYETAVHLPLTDSHKRYLSS